MISIRAGVRLPGARCRRTWRGKTLSWAGAIPAWRGRLLAPPAAGLVARCAALFLLVACLVPALRGQSLQARVFDEQDGLTSLMVTDIAQDHTGNLWVGTDNGLFEYDGTRFEEFSRAEGFNEPAINLLVVDHRGVLWAGTHTGLFWFDGRRFREAQYRGESLHIGINTMLAPRADGELIVQTAKGTFSAILDPASKTWKIELYKDRHTDYPRVKDADGIGLTAAGQLAIGCDQGICIGPQRFGPKQGVPTDYYVSFFSAGDGTLWVRGRKHILCWRQGQTRMRDCSAGFTATEMQTLQRRFTEDAHGNILTPTAAGFASWDGHAWTETSRTSKGALHSVNSIFCDREGSIWIGTEGQGLMQSLGYGRWSNYTTEEGLSSSSISGLGADRAGRVWVGNNQATNLILPGTTKTAHGVTLTSLGEGDAAQNDSSFAATPDGGMWVGSYMGALVHTTARGQVDVRTFLDGYLTGLELDPDGTLWIATSGGLYEARCTAGRACTPTLLASKSSAGNLAGKSIHDIAPDGSGGFWIASEQGLDHLQHGGVTHVQVPGLRQDFRRLARAGPDQVWLSGIEPGLVRVQVHYTVGAIVERHTRGELLSDRIQFLHVDHRHRLWIGTDHGVNVLSGDQITGITTEDGLSWNNAISLLEDRDGSFWIGTAHGLSHLLNPDAVLSRLPFTTHIQEASFGSADLLLQHQPRWHCEETSFHFAAGTFRENRALVYHYQLLGSETTPLATRAASVRFPQLPPGSYTFRVVAEDPVHHMFARPAEVHFTLVAPWQKSWIMVLLLVAICFAAINLVWHLSHRLLLAQQVRLARMVAERTREIEQLSLRDSLTGVLNRRAIMARLEEEIDYARRHETALCIALLDLDHFKHINDTYGHLAGDEVLRQSAARLADCVRGSDTIGRYGGEEFILLFRNVDRSFGLEQCERIRTCLSGSPVAYDGHQLHVTCSMGLVWSQESSALGTGLLASADRAMYQAKRKGRDRVECANLEEEMAGMLVLG